jgi:hypothetical protein
MPTPTPALPRVASEAAHTLPPRIRPEPTAEPKPSPTRRPAAGTRCSDILQKASLEPLTADEAAYLKRECR